jgi:ribosomal protein S18 acetylase RimI-like enzyme
MLTLEAPARAVTVPPADDERAIAPLLLAFSADPAARWMYPGAHQYRLFFPRFIRAFAGKAFVHGCAQALPGWRGTALWLPPGVTPDDDALRALFAESVAPGQQRELFALLHQMSAAHPKEPHWYLPLIGVDPRHQRQGLGSALLDSMLAPLDEYGALAYLEASSDENVTLYERHGFRVRRELRAGNSPTLFAMTREPQ